MVFLQFVICQQNLLTRVGLKNSQVYSLFKDYQKIKSYSSVHSIGYFKDNFKEIPFRERLKRYHFEKG